MMLGSVGCCTISLKVSAGVTTVHVCPELVERITPRSVAASTVVALAVPALARSMTRSYTGHADASDVVNTFCPKVDQLFPPSVLRNTPHPCVDSLGSPVAAYTMSGFTGSTATAPITSAH